MGGGTQRSFTITGQCGIPAGAQAVSFNFTVWNTPTTGDLRVFPAGSATPNASTLNWGAGIQALANAAVVALGSGGAITVQIDGPGMVDIFVDVNGYYTSSVGASTFTISSTGGYGIVGVSSTNVGVWGAGPTHGVFGQNSGGGLGDGVYGLSSAGYGVRGLSSTNNGVWAESTSQDGLFASGGRDGAFITGTRFGLIGESTGAGSVYGVQGQVGATATSGAGGVRGISPAVAGTYGVVGQAANASWNSPNSFLAGGRFLGSNGGINGHGAIGEGVTDGFIGYRVNAAGAVQTWGAVGSLGSDGLYSNNNITAVGTKSFVEPHPTDPTLVIKYVALEGPEAGTYFRGRGRFLGGRAIIDVPDNFRMVTDTEGLTVQVTPIGRPAAVGVVSMGLDTIEVEATKDVEFSYLVQGVRRAFRDFKPIQSDSESLYFRPQIRDAKLDQTLPEELRQRLIASGIYNPDGTVNTQTAERMGWAQKWRDDEAKAKAAQEAAASKAK